MINQFSCITNVFILYSIVYVSNKLQNTVLVKCIVENYF